MDYRARLDAELFRLMNTGLTSPYLDHFMTYVTEKFNFLGAIIVAAVLILVLGKRRDRFGLVLLVALVLVSDAASNLLKGAFMRVRPCSAIEGVRLLVGCGGSYSLPSGHATNIFAAMIFLTTRYKRFFPLFLSIAFAVAYSRVYVGVHYPSDVIAGAALGTMLAIGLAEGEKRYLRKRLIRVLEERSGKKEFD